MDRQINKQMDRKREIKRRRRRERGEKKKKSGIKVKPGKEPGCDNTLGGKPVGWKIAGES